MFRCGLSPTKMPKIARRGDPTLSGRVCPQHPWSPAAPPLSMSYGHDLGYTEFPSLQKHCGRIRGSSLHWMGFSPSKPLVLWPNPGHYPRGHYPPGHFAPRTISPRTLSPWPRPKPPRVYNKTVNNIMHIIIIIINNNNNENYETIYNDAIKFTIAGVTIYKIMIHVKCWIISPFNRCFDSYKRRMLCPTALRRFRRFDSLANIVGSNTKYNSPFWSPPEQIYVNGSTPANGR